MNVDECDERDEPERVERDDPLPGRLKVLGLAQAVGLHDGDILSKDLSYFFKVIQTKCVKKWTGKVEANEVTVLQTWFGMKDFEG